MKSRYLINGQPVYNLAKWCEGKQLKIGTFKKSLYRAKNCHNSNECKCMGFDVIRVRGGCR